MKKFEYEIITISTAHLWRSRFQAELKDIFHDYGNEGWDLMKMKSITSGGIILQSANTESFLDIFKIKNNLNSLLSV